MKFKYDLDTIIAALDYYDLKGLVAMITKTTLTNQYTSLELEEKLKNSLRGLKIEERRRIESLMISCARVNSIGF